MRVTRLAAECSIKIPKQSIVIPDGDIARPASLSGGDRLHRTRPGLDDFTKGRILHGIAKKQGQIPRGRNMAGLGQSMGICKMAVGRSDLMSLARHHLGKALHGAGDSLSEH